MLTVIRRPHYFSYELNREVVELYWNTALSNLSVNLIYIFEPIFLFNLKYSLVQIMFFYVIVYTTYVLSILPINKIASYIGYKHSILISTIIYAGYWIVLYQIKFHPNLFFIAPILFGIEKSFFWPSYNADIAISMAKEQRGREVGVLFSLIELVAIIGPIVGGFVSFTFGFPILFFMSAALMLASAYPLFRSPEIYTKHQFRFKNFRSIIRKYPQNFFAYWGYAEDLMLMSLWPLFVFIIVPHLFSVGIIITFASLIAVMVMLYLGRLIDANKRNQILPVASVFYGLTWMFRMLAVGISGVIGFDVLTRLGKAMVNIPLLSQTFKLAGAKGPDHAIAYAVFFEFSLAFGKILTALIAIWILSATASITNVFIVVGVLTMFYGFLKNGARRR